MFTNKTGNKNGNRRTANIRSVGYSDLFVLSKEDLWAALAEYPEARQRLLEKGRQMLRKDNLLDEEIARQQDLERMSPEQKLTRLELAVEETLSRLTSLTEQFNGVQKRLKQRITRAEKELREEEAKLMGEVPTRVGNNLLTVPGQGLY